MTVESKKFPIDFALALLLTCAFLAPVYGGYVVMDTTSLAPGLAAAISSAFGGPDAPLLAHTLISLPLFLGVAFVLARRRVHQVPKQLFSTVWIVFFLFLGFATLFSSYKILSLASWLEWLCYAVGMFGAVAIGGRKLGPFAVCSAISAGTALVALNAILEYGARRASDPTWRVFGGWMNPNATAAILLIGFFLCTALSLSQARAGSLISGIGSVLIGLAIILTGSKGAISLSFPLAIIAFGLMQISDSKKFVILTIFGGVIALIVGALFVKLGGWISVIVASAFAISVIAFVASDKISALRLTAILAGIVCLFGLLGITNSASKNPSGESVQTPASRLNAGSQTQEQSSEFRLNLWKSAGFLIKERPITGFGLGSFRNESGRRGIVTSTVFAHNAYLQIWAETGIIPVALFVLGVALWFKQVLRSRSTLPSLNKYLLAGIVAAVLAILSHSLVDSDFYYFGIGLTFFVVIGLGLSISSDAVAPELVQKPVRIASITALGGLLALLFVFSSSEDAKAVARHDLETRNSGQFRADTAALGWVSAFDGEALYLQSLAQPKDEAIETLRRAYDMNPTMKIARYLANQEVSLGKTSEAESVLKDSLTRDPSNFRTLNLLMQVEKSAGDEDSAVKTANKLVEIEKTPYFRVRSIPESIPTETYDARIEVLAPAATSEKERAGYLKDAVKGYLGYAAMTENILKVNAAKMGNDRDFRVPGYDSLTEASQKLTRAISAAEEAAKIYRALGDETASAEMEADRGVLAKALAASA